MWHDLIHDLTPVQQLGAGEISWKRDDLFAPNGPGSVNGSKLRQLIWLIHNRRPSDKGVVSGAVKGSPQHPMTAAVAQHYGLPCVQFVGGKDESHPMIALAKQFGADIRHANPGYAGNLNAQARKHAEQHGWFHVETNITVDHDGNDAARLEGFHRVGSEQCRNIPDTIENIFIPAGSCNSLTSILYGLARFKPKSLKTIHLFRLMANTATRQQWVNQRLDIIRKFTGEPLELPYEIVEHKLVDDGFCTYDDMMPYTYKSIEFHPRYEGKCLNYIERNPSTFKVLMNDKTLFWIIGGDPLKARTCSHRVNPAPVRQSAIPDMFYSPARATHQTPGRYCELMGIPEVPQLEAGMDFRKPEYRREVFLRFYEWSLQTRSFPGCVYFVMPHLYKTFKWDREARLWFAFLNGNTQNPVTSWTIFKRFPNLAKLKIADLDKWFNTEFKRLAFDTDRRHQKSDFMDSVGCYQKLTHGEQEDFFNGFINSEDQHENFRRAWDMVRDQFYSFGRLASFSYLEFLRIMRVNLDCDQLFLEDISGSKSHRNGLAKVLGRDDLDWHDSNPTEFAGKYTAEMLNWLNKEAALLLDEARQRVAGKPYAYDVSYFTLESAFCTYKSWHRPNRRYPGVYADMFHDRIKKAESSWPDEDFSVFWDARKLYLPEYLRLEDNPGDVGVKPEKQNHYRLTGQVVAMDHDWPCFANSYRKSSKAARAQ